MVKAWVWCFQVLGILFKSEIKVYTELQVAVILYPKLVTMQIRKTYNIETESGLK